jgi:hypothetical protein
MRRSEQITSCSACEVQDNLGYSGQGFWKSWMRESARANLDPGGSYKHHSIDLYRILFLS